MDSAKYELRKMLACCRRGKWNKESKMWVGLWKRVILESIFLHCSNRKRILYTIEIVIPLHNSHIFNTFERSLANVWRKWSKELWVSNEARVVLNVWFLCTRRLVCDNPRGWGPCRSDGGISTRSRPPCHLIRGNDCKHSHLPNDASKYVMWSYNKVIGNTCEV